MSSWPPRRPDKEAASAAAEFPEPAAAAYGAAPPASRLPAASPSRRPCGPALTPETTAAPDGSTKGQAAACPRRHAAPCAKPLTVYGWRGKGHLPARLRRPLEPGQYTAIRYTERLEETKAVRSVGSKGDSYDNAAAESLNSLYKRELIDFRKEWQGVDDVMLATMDWVSWYNEDRLHSYCGDMPPKEYEEIHYKALGSGKIKDSSQT